MHSACVITNGILKVTRFFVLTGFAVTCKFLKNIPFYWKFSPLNLNLKAIFFPKHIGVGLFRSSLMGQNICIYSLCAKEVLLFFVTAQNWLKFYASSCSTLQKMLISAKNDETCAGNGGGRFKWLLHGSCFLVRSLQTRKGSSRMLGSRYF